GVATVGQDGIEIGRAPEGIVFEPLDEGHERLGQLVGGDEKFAAHNAALWKHGLLVHVPRGVELERPLYVRVSAPFWRLLVVAGEGSRFSLVEEYVSADEGEAYSNAVAELRLRLQGHAPGRGELGLARDDPRREGRAEDERLPGEPEPFALAQGARRLDPGPGDPGERRALHPRSDGEPGQSRRALLRD